MKINKTYLLAFRTVQDVSGAHLEVCIPAIGHTFRYHTNTSKMPIPRSTRQWLQHNAVIQTATTALQNYATSTGVLPRDAVFTHEREQEFVQVPYEFTLEAPSSLEDIQSRIEGMLSGIIPSDMVPKGSVVLWSIRSVQQEDGTLRTSLHSITVENIGGIADDRAQD